MFQHVTGGIVALAWAGHCHTVGGVWAAVLGRVQLPAELTRDGEGEVGLLLSRLSYTVNSFFGFTEEGCWFLVGAVVMVIAVHAICWQATTLPSTRTLGSIALFICRRHWGCSRDHWAGDDRPMLGISGVGSLLANMRRAQIAVNTL